MAYNSAIPAANDLLSKSQGDIQTNFDSIQTLIEIDHEAFDVANQGKHLQTTFPEQAADPATIANEKSIYAKESTLSGVAELFIRNESNGTVHEFTSSTQAANGWTRLPSGILFKWGTGLVNGPYPRTFALPVAATVPVYTTIFSVVLTPNGDGGAGAYDYMPYLTAFAAAPDTISIYGSARTVNGAVNNVNFRYLVIGV